MEKENPIPFEATLPGSLIKDELEERGISQKDFARDIGLQPTVLNELIKGKRAITADIAILLGKALGIRAGYWMRFQAQYELDVARIKERNIQKIQEIGIWASIKQYVPVLELEKQGLYGKSLHENIQTTWSIYGADSVEELYAGVITHAKFNFYNKSEKLQNDQVNIYGWSKLAQWYVKDQRVEVFDPACREILISELKALFYKNVEVVGNTRKILNKHGIKFRILEKFNQTPIDGYSFWSANNPAIVITMRKSQLDNFAFTIMHELAHVFDYLHSNHNQSFLDIDCPECPLNHKEQEAHSRAKRCFIEDAVWQDFLYQNKPFSYKTTELEIMKLSTSLKVPPCIILGRYCFETNKFNYRTKINRSIG